MTKVGVAMAAYNVREYVRAAVESILTQTFRDLELVVVDDGSTDGTDAVLAGIRDPRLRVVRTENRGVTYARNRAYDEVTAPFVAVMDSDDLSHPERIERQVRHLEEHPDLVAVGCSVWLMDPAGNPIYEDVASTGPERVLAELRGDGGGVYPAVCTMRTEIVKKVGGYRHAVPVSEDLDLLLRMTEFGGIDNLRESLYSYRLHGSSLTFSGKARRDHYAHVALALWKERQTTGTDRVDRGETVDPFVPTESNGTAYTQSSVLAFWYRRAAVEAAARGQRWPAVRKLLSSLRHAPGDRNTWRAMAEVARGRRSTG